MKEKMMKSIIRILMTFFVASAGLFGFVNVDSQEIVKVAAADKIVNVVPVVEEVKEEEAVPEETVVEKVVEEIPAVQTVVPEVVPVSQPVNTFRCDSGNTIEVAGVKRCLMKDYNGDHFYLNHNQDGIQDNIGVPYVDFRHDFTGRKTILYSHSSTNGNGPFQPLQQYHKNSGFYWNNRTISINYQGNNYQYLIFSVYVSTADSEESEGLEYFHKNYYSDSEWEETLQNYRSRSEYDTGVEVHSNDQIIILQTCSMDPEYYARYYRYNLLIMGKLIK